MEKIDTDCKRNFSRCANHDAGSLRGMLGFERKLHFLASILDITSCNFMDKFAFKFMLLYS